MDKATVNSSLKRNIKNGNQYNEYFEDTPCTSSYLGESNTDFTLEQMKLWANKYAYQTKAIAEVLKGATLKETVDNIYQFLYNHFQYEIDGADQMLKSPACAWKTRSDGMDCKSFSLICQTILQNLGISSSFRKVKQASLSPNYWTHVYVVIPTNQSTKKLSNGYLIVDATIFPNKEVAYTQKKDLKMDVKLKHWGLNAGVTTEQNELTQAVAKFQSFLDLAESKGATREQTQSILNKLQVSLENGVDPLMSDIFPVSSLGAGEDDATTSDGGGFVDSIDWGELASDMFDSNFFGDTFGAIFANGFNLSCWNSTFTPAKVTAEVSKVHVPYFNNQLTAVRNSKTTAQLTSTLNALLRSVGICHTMYTKYLVNGANWEKCSQEAIDIYVQLMNGLKGQTDVMLDIIKSNYDITISTSAPVPAQFVFPASMTNYGQDFSWSEAQWGNATYQTVVFNEDINSNPVNPSPIDNNNPTEDTDNPIDTDGVIISPNQPKTASFSYVAGGLLLAVALGTIAYNQKNKKNEKK